MDDKSEKTYAREMFATLHYIYMLLSEPRLLTTEELIEIREACGKVLDKARGIK